MAALHAPAACQHSQVGRDGVRLLCELGSRVAHFVLCTAEMKVGTALRTHGCIGLPR